MLSVHQIPFIFLFLGTEKIGSGQWYVRKGDVCLSQAEAVEISSVILQLCSSFTMEPEAPNDPEPSF